MTMTRIKALETVLEWPASTEADTSTCAGDHVYAAKERGDVLAALATPEEIATLTEETP